MRTEDLILVLANGPRPRGRAAVVKRMGLALVVSLAGALLVLLEDCERGELIVRYATGPASSASERQAWCASASRRPV